MRFLIFIFFFSLSAHAALPQQASEVEIIKEEDLATFENIPRISMYFRGAKNREQQEILEDKCQSWVFDTMKQETAPYFKVWCTLTKDIILREYTYTANLLIKNWQ